MSSQSARRAVRANLRPKQLNPKKSSAKKAAKAGLSARDVFKNLRAQNKSLLETQARLEESRNQYAELFDRAPVGYLILTGGGQVKKANFAAALLLGVTREKFKNMNLNRFVHDRGELTKLLTHLRYCRDEEINVTTPLNLKSATGAMLPVELISYPIGNQPALYQTAIIDLSGRQKAEQALRASEERFRNMGNHAPILIWIADTDKECTWFNQRWLDFVGRPMERELGSGWTENVHPDDLAGCVNIYHEKFDGRQAFEIEYRLRRHDGQYRWMVDYGVPVNDGAGKFSGYIGSCIDITDRKHGQDELAKANRAKDDFLAALSHELRTPLNPALLLASDAAKDPELSPRARTYFDTIRKSIELEARLIDDLLDITGITHGKFALERNTIDAHAVLNAALATVQAEMAKKKIDLKLKLDAAQHAILGDGVRLQQIFWNVLKNAIKFTPASGKILIETQSVDNEKLTVKITDTGIGMDTGEMDKIFGAFAQGAHGDNGGSHQFGGLGLGLAISRALVEKLFGRIHAHSAGKDQGATFTIEFPLIKQGDEQPVEPAERVSKGGSHKAAGERTPGRSILLVEDHEPTRSTLTQLLLRRNFKVTGAGTVAEARVQAKKQTFDLLISDIGLPDGNGYDLMAELHAQHGLKGIALTGYGMEQDMNRSYAAGFISHLTKPVRMQSLEELLAAIFGGKKNPTT